VINSVRGAVGSAVEGHWVTRLFSYHVAPQLRDGSLRLILAKDEPPPIPVHVITPHGRLAAPKVRAFVDFAMPRLKASFVRINA
jgi:DNA-binding transcriptional LysR family regulator